MARQTSLPFPIAIAAGILLAGLVVSLAVGFAILQPSKSRVEAQLTERERQVTELEETLAAKDARIHELLTLQGDAQEELARATVGLSSNTTETEEARAAAQQLQAELDQAQTVAAQQVEEITTLEASVASLTVFKTTVEVLQEAVGPLGTDRLLLVELRKDAPEDLQAATEYYENIKKLAVQSDPSLGPKADRILRLLPTYFNYLDSASEATACEGIFSAYATSGVADYFTVESDFQKDMLLVLINRIDTLFTTVS